MSGAYGILWLNHTDDEVYFDLEDAELITQYSWYLSRDGYARACVDGKLIKMHKLLGYYWVDHNNWNKLDNRKENLIPCNPKENARNRPPSKANRTGIIGVIQRQKTKDIRWEANIWYDNKTHYLGVFDNKEDAIVVRLNAEKEIFGKFAPQKHLFKEYGLED